MGNCLLNSLRLSINRRGGSSPLRFVERQDEGRARGCAPVPGQGIGAALRCLFRMAAGGQAPYVEPWDLEKNKTSQNKLIQDMFISSRGRLQALARRRSTPLRGRKPASMFCRQTARKRSRDLSWRRRSASSSKLLKHCKPRRRMLEPASIRHHLGLSWLLRALPKKILCSKWL